MATQNPETRALYTRLREVLGDDHADTLMTYLPAQPGSELATRSNIDALDARLDQRFEKLDERFEKLDERFEKLDERIYELHFALNNQLRNYSIIMVAGMTALTGIYASLLTIVT